MAMPSLLKRISRSVLQSPSVFRLEPVQGIPPAMASRIMGTQSPRAMASRFMGTQSQGEQRVCETFDAEQMTARLNESIKAMHQKAVNDLQMLRAQIAEVDQDMRRELNELTGLFNNLRRAGTACAAALVAVPLTMILWSEYQA